MKTRMRNVTLGAMLAVLFTMQYAEAGWTLIDKPGAQTYSFGIDGGNIVGYYSGFHGFLYDGTNWTTIDFPGMPITTPIDIDGGNIVGPYYDESGHAHGFLYDGTTWETIDFQGAEDTVVYAIDGGYIVGCYGSPGAYHGFLYDGTNWTTFDAPGASMTIAQGIDIDRGTRGTIVGYGGAAPDYGWLYDIDTKVFTPFYGPGGGRAFPFDIEGNNIIGTYHEVGGGGHGFLYDGTTWTTLDFPGAVGTYPVDIDGNKIVGYYDAPGSPGHGFIYTFNQAPVAICQDVLVAVGANGYVDASVDGGSYDPDGDSIVYSQDPAGPYPVGVYTVTLTVTDPYGASDSCQAMLVVYDPSGGFVTGGGWIRSPKGAYMADPWLEGKANFGFVSKYKKGASVPTGQTEFVFQAGDLNFHSSSYDWLVVNQNGSNAQFKGSGTINGAGNYKFMLWAGDGAPDTFRIKIWEENGGEVVVYDNGFNQAIGGGSIVIHTK